MIELLQNLDEDQLVDDLTTWFLTMFAAFVPFMGFAAAAMAHV